jgi:ABC-2 type transport system ATP-binding protein
VNVIELENVVKKYENHIAVNGVSFSIPKGKVFGLLGPNGAGKTSIIRIITAITRSDTGIVRFNGEVLNQSHPDQIGYMPEERGLYKKMKVGEQIMYLARLKGLTKDKATERLNYWMNRFDISSWKNKKIEELSKGMQQKIQFISTIIHEPELLILDEPFSGLDPVNANLIREEIDELNRNGTTILFSTHRMEQVEQICEEIVLINKGQNVLSGRVQDIKEQFKEHLYQIEYIGELPTLPETVECVESSEGKLVVQLKHADDANALLERLIQQGVSIRSFHEILPTLNEIFIKIVEGNSDE